MAVKATTAIEMIFQPAQKRASSALFHLPFDSSGCNSASSKGGATTYTGGIIFDTTCNVGLGAVQTAEATTNLITNPSFETGVTGWVAVGNNEIGYSPDQARYGIRSMFVIYQDSDALCYYNIILQLLHVLLTQLVLGRMYLFM